MIKGREVREQLKDKVDPVVIHVVAELAEQQGVLREQLSMMALQHDQLIDIVTQMTEIAANMKIASDALQKKDDQV